MKISTRSTAPSAAARIALLLACAGSLGACMSIPQRAWRNGEGMAGSRAYQAVMSGDMSFRAHRELESSLDPLRVYSQDLPFRPFADWWW